MKAAIICWGLVGAAALGTGAARAEAELAPTAKLERVLVYSTLARISHVAHLQLDDTSRAVSLVDLPPAARRDSVQVSAKSAEVVRVELIQARSALPSQLKAKELVEKLEASLDRLRDLDNERQVLEREQALLAALSLRREPLRGKAALEEGLYVEGWRRVLSWLELRAGRTRSRLQLLAGQRFTEGQGLARLQLEARSLDLGAAERPVSRVVATLRAARAAKHLVTVSYLVERASWIPSYDLRYDPGRRVVEATYYANVTQTSGEEWPAAKLSFSTAMPTEQLALPELPSWLLGRSREYLPTPRRREEAPLRAWVPPAPEEPRDLLAERLRGLLQPTSTLPSGTALPKDQAKTEDAPLVQEARKPRPLPGPLPSARPTASPAPAQAMPSAPPALEEAAGAPPARASQFGYKQELPSESVPWTAQGYSLPPLAPDLPAAAAGGYRFTLEAPGTHTILAHGRAQRIPLLRQTLKVQPRYQIVPGASAQAYLMAVLENTTGRPILRGHANLYTGEVFSGSSWLNTSLPGRTLHLPLGVDDAVKVARRTHQRTVAEGVILREDVSEHTVEIEVANHHRYPISVEVRDQMPIAQGPKVAIKAFRADPPLQGPDQQGFVRWEGTLAASAVRRLTFSYRIARPRNWELRQAND